VWRTGCDPLRCVLLLLPLLAGCGGKDYTAVPVSGRVTLDGTPLQDVGIVFVPLATGRDDPNIGPGSLGRTDADGRFTLRTVRGDKGAVPTEHVVRMAFATAQSDLDGPEGFAPVGSNVPGPAPQRSGLPRQALDGSLHFEVPPQGTDQANFDFVSP
jgi:hypothetical protein